MLSAFAQAPNAALEDFARIGAAPPEARYPHVRVAGHFIGRGSLRDEQVRDGKLGVEVIDAFAVDGNASLLLVSRGWVAWAHASGTRPSLPPLALGDTLLSGVYAPFPGSGIRVGGNALPAQAAWPKLTLVIDPGEISADLGAPLLPRMLQLDADATSGFVRTWTPALMPPARHQAYARIPVVCVRLRGGGDFCRAALEKSGNMTVKTNTRNRITLIAVVLLFAAPLLIAWLLNATGWHPAKTRNHGDLIEPARDVSAASVTLSDGS